MWTETEQSSCDRLKAVLVDAPVLAIHDLTESTSFVIETDTSDVTIGSILSQVKGSGLQLVCLLLKQVILCVV